MFKAIMLLSVLSLSSVFANDEVTNAISEIELDKNAKCDFVKSSGSFCLSYLCFSKKTYMCTSNEADFKVEIKIKESSATGSEDYMKVRSVKIIE